uniref:Uncharacterized protein n=1 Tax=Vannella robusta TaxID=1487602 RepID=A0A7S4MI44_9EUKA|mmetsp:Transcript_22753/g.29049  ORF Transcript_22753/g.29049 Transcript_22753/m.29049 type:complete len:756 (+) Transcript_22753:47-2314(+)
MEQLLPVINKLQDVFSAIGGDRIDLPQICVIGSQSSGKSSVLEHIVGKDFLPRGSGIVTRRPLVLQLHHIAAPKQGQPQEWGEFLHQPKKIYTDFEKIRQEIAAETERHCGPRGISNNAIRLSVYSPNVLNLTLVDLPGLTKVTIPGQPVDLPEQIRKMAVHYIGNPNAIILCVSAGNTDIATSDGIQLAQEIDPDGSRTLGVVTKIDIMDKGTDAMDILTGQVIPLQLGFVGVVMRSQQDIKDGKAISEALKDEEKFFATHPAYRQISSRLGTRYLTRTLNSILMQHIRKTLPELKARISKMTQDCQQEMASYGDSMFQQNKSGMLLNIINTFSKDYSCAIDGKLEELSVNELYGGARINYIFTEVFSKYVESVRESDAINDQDIRTAIKNSTGPRSALFVPEGSFEFLVKNLVKRLEDPSQECVEQVFTELQRIVSQLTESKELQRFKNLKVRLADVVNNLLHDCKIPTRMMISNLINIELAYVNTNHEDFIGGGGAVSQLFETMAADHQQQQQQQQAAPQTYNPSGGPPPQPQRPQQPPQSQPKSSQPQQNNQQQGQEANGGFFGRYFGGNSPQPQQGHRPAPQPPRGPSPQQPQRPGVQPLQPQRQGQQQQAPAQQQAPKQKLPDKNPFQSVPGGPITLTMPTSIRATSPMNQKEKFETQLIKQLIGSYFDIVCKNISDTIPKTIMHFLVNTSKANMQNQLVEHLYKEDLFAELLEENPEIAMRRKRCAEMLDALLKANRVLMELRDFDFR